VKKLEAPIPRVTLTVPEAAASMGRGVDWFNEHVRPEVLVIRKGSGVLIPFEELQQWARDNAERVLP